MAFDKDPKTHSVFVMNGASNHCLDKREENDYYATPPFIVKELLKHENFSDNIWEPATGGDHITNVLREYGYNVRASDIVDRTGNTEILDFLSTDELFDGDIVTNPPYSLCVEFILKALDTITEGHKVAMFLRTTCLEGKKRYDKIFKRNELKTVYVSVRRADCPRGGQFGHKSQSAISFSWFVFEKGYHGDPVVKWINY